MADANVRPADVARIYAAPGLATPTDLNHGFPAVVPEEMTGMCGGASAAVQLACALLEPLAAPQLILAADETGTVVALVLVPWSPSKDGL